jgi:hypothetical protein
MQRLLRAFAMFVVLALGIARADVVQTSPGVFVAGVRTENFQYVAAEGRQHSPNWCWAACIQMVLQYHGLEVSQEQIVQKVYGGLVDRPANGPQIIYALNGWMPDGEGHAARVRATSYGVSEQTVIDDLVHARPLIVGMHGWSGNHAYVLTAISFSKDAYGGVHPLGVVLRDPWPNSMSRQEWPWQQFAPRVNFVARVQVEH